MVKFCKTAYLADFLKTNLTKFAVINHSNEGKGKEKKKERGKGKGEKKKKAMVALLVFIIATLEIVIGRKKLFD